MPELEANAEGIKTQSLRGPAAPASEQPAFALLRHFSIGSLVAIVAAAVALGFLYREVAVRQLIELGQDSNIALAKAFRNTLRADYVPLLSAAGGLSAEELKALPEVAVLHQEVLRAVQLTPVVKVKVYDLTGRTLYSSEFRQISEDKRADPGFVAARAGDVKSVLYERESFYAFGQTIMNRRLLGSYVPVRQAGSDALEAVFELYSDVTPLYEEIGRTQVKVVAGVAAVLALLYGILFAIVKRADDLLKRHAEERKQADQAIRHHAMQQSLIAAFGQRALASTDLDELLDQAVAVVREGLAVPFCKVLQLGPDGRSLILKSGSGWETGWIGRVGTAESGSQDRFLLDARKPLVVEDLPRESRFAVSEILKVHAIRCSIEVLIGGSGGPFGILGAYWREQMPFAPESVLFLQSIANILETAVHRKSSEERLAYLAQFDALTGLPNRSLLSDRLAQTLTLAKRNSWAAGAMYIDLDRFKAVNDTYGHGVGDKLLKLVAMRLQECTRSGDTVGRLGGDEFAIVMSNLAKADDANLVAQKVVSALARPFDLDGHQTYMTASLGIALYPGDGEDPEVLLKNADTAMFRAKEQGRNAYRFYLPQMNARAAARLQVETQLRGALERGEFLLLYQPKANLASGEISGFEALLRWQHPERGMVPPLEFISILEETGLIVAVGEWVVRSACAQIKRWQEQGVTPRPIAVNLSARQFQQKNLHLVIAGILADSGIDPGLLELELTETMLMKNAEEAVRTLSKIRADGVRLAIDDFGTGYSSLAYLRRFPLDVLKIDRAFIRDAVTDPDGAAIVLAMISLAHSMRLKVVAEGVETEGELNFLRLHGCDEMQGYYFARPLPAAECTQALLENRRLKAPAIGALPGAPAILLVDDSHEDVELLKRALAPDGYRIVTAHSAAAGFEALAQSAFQIVISDYAMPGMNGVEFLAGVRTLHPDAVRIMVSGVGDIAMVSDAVNEAGVHKYLAKDGDAARTRAAVREAYLRHREEIKPEV